MTHDLAWMDGTAQAELVRTREVSAAELVEAAITRIEKLDPEINAVIHRTFEKATQAARKGPADGPFAGVPFLVKDLYADTAGDPAHDGMKAMKDAGFRAADDHWLTARFRRAGFVFLGRTNTPELGLVPTTEPVAYGPTRNPWNTDHTAGGSSGGSAAAVAAGMVPVAHASDGGGSIRIPASMCGLVGLKVTRGRTSLGPDLDESGLSVQHVVSRSVRDTAAALDAVCGPGPGDMAVAPPPLRPYAGEVEQDPPRLRIGFLAANPSGGLHADCAAAARDAAALLADLGHDVDESHPAALDAAQERGREFFARWCTNARMGVINHGRKIGRELGPDDVEPATWFMAEMGATFSAVDLASALSASARYTREMARWWADGWDILVTPTLGQPPPRIGALAVDPANPMPSQIATAALVPFTTHFNVTGQPAISLPLYWNGDGLPIGVQLVAAYGREDLLLALAGQLERARPWAHRRPPVSL
jgi:amidase